MEPRTVKRRLAAILSADVVGYAKLMLADEIATYSALQRCRRELIDPLVAKHSGRVFKAMGDGFLVEFGSAVDAVSCAIAVQQRLAETTVGVARHTQIAFRIGVNLGEVIIEGDDLLGDGVNIAARLQEIAEPGSVFLSAIVHEQVAGKIEVELSDLGERQAKKLNKPLRVFRWPSGPETQDYPLPPETDKPSIVVLPFDNMSGDPEQEFFSDGLTEDIITDLAKISGLLVIARNSAFVYKRKAVDIRQVTRALGVRYALEGAMRKVGSKVRVTAQLIDGATGGHIWAERYESSQTDIYAVQDEVTHGIVEALSVQLSPAELAQLRRAPTAAARVDPPQMTLNYRLKNPENPLKAAKRSDTDIKIGARVTGPRPGGDHPVAYECFLRARDLASRNSRKANREARRMFRQAAELNPKFVEAIVGEALTHFTSFERLWTDSPDASLDWGQDLAQKALAVDPASAEGHLALAMAKLWRYEHEAAIAEAERALAIEPNLARGYAILGRVRHFCSEPERAIEHYGVCGRLDPVLGDIMLQYVAEAYFSLGQYKLAIGSLNWRLMRDPQADQSLVLLAACKGHIGQHAEARDDWEKTATMNPDSDLSLDRLRQVMPFRDPTAFDRILDGLRLAGIDVEAAQRQASDKTRGPHLRHSEHARSSLRRPAQDN